MDNYGILSLAPALIAVIWIIMVSFLWLLL